jgi:uncharacterized protein (TIGR03067 family)
MHRVYLLSAVLFVVPLLGSGSPKEYDDRTTVDPLEGTWRLTGSEFRDTKEKHSQPLTTFRNGIVTEDYDFGKYVGTYDVDLTRKPSHLDMTQSKSKASKYIYKIDGDTLRIALINGLGEMRRPQDFTDKDVFITIYKRVK